MRFLSNRTLVSCFMMAFPVLFFAYQFTVRVMPSLLTKQIMQTLSIDATTFGFLIGSYYLGIALANIPTAMLLERYAPGFVIGINASLCGLLLFAFHNTDNGYTAIAIRFLLGVVSSAGFTGVSRVTLQWFGKEEYGFVLSCSLTLALLGSLFGGAPLGSLINAYGTKTMINALMIFSFFISAGALVFLTSSRNKRPESMPRMKFVDLLQVLCSGELLLLGICSILMMGISHGFVDLWAVPYFVASHDISRTEAAAIVGCNVIGVMVGGPILAFIGRRIGAAVVIAATGVAEAVVFYGIILSNIHFNWWLFGSTMFILGLFSSGRVLFFSMCVRLFSPNVAAVAVSCLGCVFMVGGVCFHNVIGALLDYVTYGGPVYSLVQGQYPVESFRIALLVIPIGCVLGAGLTLLTDKLYVERHA